MMRSDDPFENQLAKIPLRQLPGEWRNSILAAAEAAVPKKSTAFEWAGWISFFLNPRPASWAAVAAVWVLAFIFNSQTPMKNSRSMAKSSEPISAIMRERQNMLATVFDSSTPNPVAPPPRKRIPGPQGRAPITLIFV
jgi:hypothetical protein